MNICPRCKNSYPWNAVYCFDADLCVSCAEAELLASRKALSNLPKTVDGVVITPDSDIWCLTISGIIVQLKGLTAFNWHKKLDYYSTYAAAEAAKESK